MGVLSFPRLFCATVRKPEASFDCVAERENSDLLVRYLLSALRSVVDIPALSGLAHRMALVWIVLFSIAFPAALYHFLEDPMIKLGKRLTAAASVAELKEAINEEAAAPVP